MVLDYPNKDKSTLREHLECIERQTGKRSADLDSVRVPSGAWAIWNTFWELRKGERLTYSELQAYSALTGDKLTTFDVEAIMAMDGECQAYIDEQMRKDFHA